jgi:hypothetical protein
VQVDLALLAQAPTRGAAVPVVHNLASLLMSSIPRPQPSDLSLSTDSVSLSLATSESSYLRTVSPSDQLNSMVEIKPSGQDPSHSPESEDYEGSQYRLLYSKSKVYVNPTVYARDNIPGFVALVKRVGKRCMSTISANAVTQEAVNPTCLIAWLPETLLNEKGQAEWDKFVRTEERTSLHEDEEEEGM